MHPAFLTVPPLRPGCRISVTIPARNEAGHIERTLMAFAAQRGIDGAPLPPHFFEVVVLANGCRDDTAARARDVARANPHLPINVVEVHLQPRVAHVGTARKLVMDFAARRMLGGARSSGLITSNDADTIVDPAWIAWLERESREADAVAGFVTIGDRELAAMQAPVRVLYSRERAYRRLLAALEAVVDPRPEDPTPRHGAFVGACFGVKADVYLAAGGMVPLRRLEDQAFVAALHRIDARIRYSLRVRATTSARVRSRVAGGFGTFVADLVARGERRESFHVEAARESLDTFAARAALRRIWNDAEKPGDCEVVTSIFRIRAAVWRPCIDRALPFGRASERIATLAASTRRRYARVPVEDAIRALRAAAASSKAVRPMRTSAASGAG
jgi:glycosyltransferase involved in cell wall biosynthesis